MPTKHASDVLTRRAPTARKSSWNAADRTFEVVVSTFADVRRWFGIERLSRTVADWDLSRVDSPAGVPFLLAHDAYMPGAKIGRVLSIAVGKNDVRAVVQLGTGEPAEALVRDLETIGVACSFGYAVSRWERIEEDDAPEIRVAKAISILEVSAVSIAADPGAHVRSSPMTTKTKNNAPAIEPSDDDLESLGREEERTRVAEIHSMAVRNNMSSRFVAKHIKDGTNVADFGRAVLDKLAERSAADPQLSGITVGHSWDNPSVVRDLRAEALAARFGGPASSDAARQYMNDRLIDHAAWAVEASGRSARGMAPDQIFARSAGAHTTSDFPLLLQGVGNRILMQAYELAQSPLKAVLARETKLPDFRPRMRIKLSDIGHLEKLGESGEPRSTTSDEVQESTSLDTFARAFALSRKAKINDDLGALADWSRAAGRAAAETENSLLYTMFTQSAGAGPVMGEDNKRLFHADHGNLAASGTALDETNLSAARLAMRKVKGLDGKTPVNVAPAYLMVGPELETSAEKLLAQIYAATAATANPFSGRLELLVEGLIANKAWYVFAKPAALPVLEYAHLESAPGPQVATEEDFDTLATKFRVVLDFGCSAIDWRGAYRNPWRLIQLPGLRAVQAGQGCMAILSLTLCAMPPRRVSLAPVAVSTAWLRSWSYLQPSRAARPESWRRFLLSRKPMSLFDRLDQMTSRAVDRVNAVDFTFTPMTGPPNGRREFDASRSIVAGRGILDMVDDDMPLELGSRDRSGNDLRALLSGSTPVLSLDRSYFPTAASEPRQGDRIEFPGRSDLGTMEVVSVQRDGLARTVLQLARF